MSGLGTVALTKHHFFSFFFFTFYFSFNFRYSFIQLRVLEVRKMGVMGGSMGKRRKFVVSLYCFHLNVQTFYRKQGYGYQAKDFNDHCCGVYQQIDVFEDAF